MQIKVSPLTKIISLSGFLALGFLLSILSCALFHNYYPVFDIAIFLIAPIPNSLFGKSSSGSSYSTSDFMLDESGNEHDFAHFLTGVLVTSGFALPVVFTHCNLINSVACVMAMLGGFIIYSSVVIFSWFFKRSWDNEDDTLFS